VVSLSLNDVSYSRESNRPMNCFIWPAVCGLAKSSTFVIFLFDIDNPSFEITLPQYSTRGVPNLHLLGLKNIFLSRNRISTNCSLSRNWSSPLPCTIQSSRYILRPQMTSSVGNKKVLVLVRTAIYRTRIFRKNK
jgi:hypothetical protein